MGFETLFHIQMSQQVSLVLQNLLGTVFSEIMTQEASSSKAKDLCLAFMTLLELITAEAQQCC